MRNTILYKVLCLMIVALFVLSSCAKQTTATTKPAENTAVPKPVKLVVWWWGEPEAAGSGKWLETQTQKYTKLHPNVTFEMVEQSIDSVVTGFRAAAASKSGPDIAFMFGGGVYVAEDVWAGNLAAISDYVTPEQMSTWIDTGSKTFDGKLWSVPFYMQSYLMMYNKKLFTQAGLDPNSPPKTIDELVSMCKTFRSKGINAMASGLKDAFQADVYYSNLAQQSLSNNHAIQQASVGEGSFTDSQHAGWFGAIEKMVKADCFNNDVNSLDLYSGWEVFGRGEAAMLQANDAYLPIAVKNLGAENVGLMHMPSFATSPTSNSMCYFAQGLAITSWSQNKEVAADFLVSLHEKEAVDDFFKTTGIPFADTKFDKSLITSPFQKEEFAWISSSPQMCAENLMPQQVLNNGIHAAAQGIFQKSLTAEQAAQEVEGVAKNWRDSNPPNFDKWLDWAHAK